MPIDSEEKVTPFVHWRTVSFGDTDAAAIVYTTRFTDYCMQAVEVWFKQYIGIDWYWINVRDKRGTPVVHLEMDFHGPLIAGDQLGVLLEVAEIGRATLTLTLKGSKKSDSSESLMPVFTGKYVFCFVDTEENRSIPIPPESLERIVSYQKSCEIAHGVAGPGE